MADYWADTWDEMKAVSKADLSVAKSADLMAVPKAARKVLSQVALTADLKVEKSVVRKVVKKADNLAATLDVKRVAWWVAL